MTTITRERLEWLSKISSRDEIDDIGGDEIRELARIALASLEAEAVAYMHRSGQVVMREECCDDKTFAICCKVETPLYTAPPAPVSVPDYPETLPCPVMLEPGLRFGKGVNTRTMLDALQRRAEYHAELEAMTPEQRADHDAGMKEFAAMLQGSQTVSNRDELPLDYLQGHKDGLEWAAQLAEANHPQTGDWLYDDQTELAKAIRKGPDMPEADGNSPVIPDGWVILPAEPTQAMMNAWLSEVANWRGHAAGYRAMIAAAPQQEV